MSADSASLSSRISATIRQFVPGNKEQPFPPSKSTAPNQQATAAAATGTSNPGLAPANPLPPAAAKPPKPASAAPAVTSSAGEEIQIAEVWSRGDKFARGALANPSAGPSGVSTADLPARVPVKGYVRSAPGTAGEKPVEKEKLPITREAIVKEYGKNERQTTRRILFVGGLVHNWILRQPDRPANEQLDRASALKILRRALIEARYDRRSCRVARLLGGEAESLSISAIREMQPLIERLKNEAERWQLVPAYAEAAGNLWSRMLQEKLSGDAVRIEVEKLLHPNPLPLESQRKKSRLSRLRKTLAELSIEELKQVVRWSKAELAKSQPGSSPAAA